MPTPSGADFLLDDDEFFVDRSIPEHYVHQWVDSNAEDDATLTGAPGKSKSFTNNLYWTYDDWAGGEGNRIYYPDDYDVYDVGYELNPRIRGQLTGRPNRLVTTVAAKDVTDRPFMTIGAGAVWLGGGYKINHSTAAPGTWTEHTTSASAAADFVGLRSLSVNYRITAMCGDNDYVYYSAWHSGSTGSRAFLRAKKTDAALADTVETQQATGIAPFAGLAMMHGKVYGWTGRKLFEYDPSTADITTSVSGGCTTAAGTKTKVYDTRVEPASTNVFSTDWWAELVATENSLVMFYSNDGVSEVYEYKKGVGKPIWRPPYGFTIKGSAYANGVMYFSGHWGGDSNNTGSGVMYALPLDSYRPIPLKEVRANQDVNLQMQEMHASYGYQVVCIAGHTGRIFIYDAKADGLSMLDDLGGTNADGVVFTDNNYRIAGSITFGLNRYFAVYQPGGSGSGTYQIIYYKQDRPESREVTMNTTAYTTYLGYFDSSRWDYDYPLDQKTLLGFHVAFKPITAATQFIDVSYCLDQASDTDSYTALTQITSSTTGAATGRVYIPVSTVAAQKKFFTLKFRVTLSSSGGSKTPILYAITAESKLTRKRETWEIAVRLKDEPSRNRPTNRAVKGWRLRDYLEQTIEAGNIVTFHDGYRYATDRAYATPYSTHNVIIEKATDVIIKPGEGYCLLKLRSVDD